uniref:DUF4283 domain-containing protein n=1 Tax=Kalanchoe fedtschenkoi TaxID=63787 RepID=A0A7N0V766_KALFE
MSPSLYTVKNYVRKRWGDERVVSVQEQRRGVFIFFFESKINMDEVMEKGPWPFDNQPLIL